MNAPRPSKALSKRNVLNRSSGFGPNMTPMVDVTLVILIFFMASATIVGHEWFLRADLPKTQDSAPKASDFSLPTPMLWADLFIHENQIFVRGINDEPTSLIGVIKLISAMEPSVADGFILGIRAHDDVPYWAVIALHEAASTMKIRVSIR